MNLTIQDWNFLINKVAMATVCTIGMIGNAILILLFSMMNRNGVRIWTKLRIYLLTISALDFTVAVCSFFGFCLPTFLSSFQRNQKMILTARLVNSMISNGAWLSSTWITVLVAIDRFIAIYRPMKHISIRTKTRCHTMIAVIAFAIVIDLPILFETHLYQVVNANLTIYKMEWNRFVFNTSYFILYRLLVALIFEQLGPILILLTLSLIIVFHLRKRNSFLQSQISELYFAMNPLVSRMVTERQQAQANANREAHRRTNQISVYICLKVLCLNTMPFVINLIQAIHGRQTFTGNLTFTVLLYVSNLLVVVNCSICVFMYLSQPYFRRWLLSVYQKRFSNAMITEPL